MTDIPSLSARCCYSCRAFFRRRAMKQEKVRCRSSEGDCQVTSQGKKCVACRYRKCLRIGMDPLLVQVRDQITLLSWSPAPVTVIFLGDKKQTTREEGK